MTSVHYSLYTIKGKQCNVQGLVAKCSVLCMSKMLKTLARKLTKLYDKKDTSYDTKEEMGIFSMVIKRATVHFAYYPISQTIVPNFCG